MSIYKWCTDTKIKQITSKHARIHIHIHIHARMHTHEYIFTNVPSPATVWITPHCQIWENRLHSIFVFIILVTSVIVTLLHACIRGRIRYQKYFDMFVTNGLFPLITLPTHEGKHSATLIDQIFCKVKNFTDIDSSGILKSSLSDHYQCPASLDICKKKQHKPKYVTINNKNEQALISFCNEVETRLNEWQINRDLFANPNDNYNIFDKITMDAKAKYLSPKTVRFTKYKHNISPWMNRDKLRSIKDRDDLYRTVLSTPPEHPIYDSLRKIYKTWNLLWKRKFDVQKGNIMLMYLRRISQTFVIHGEQ